MVLIDFDVKRKMKRNFSEAKLKAYIFGEDYKEDPKEHLVDLKFTVREAEKYIKKLQKERQDREAQGETDVEFLDSLYYSPCTQKRMDAAKKKIAEGDYLQTEEDFAYRKEWTKRWCYFEACICNSESSVKDYITIYDNEYNFKTTGYNWD